MGLGSIRRSTLAIAVLAATAAAAGATPRGTLSAPAPVAPDSAVVAATGRTLPPPVLRSAAAAAPGHRRRVASSLPADRRRILVERNLAGSAAASPQKTTLDPALRARIDALLSPTAMRADGAAAVAPALAGRDPDKGLPPWTADRLLANPTNMNDEYVSLAVSPLTGDLWATFAATDLGGTDRDIHIARSRDDGQTWTVWEMPSYPEDEYHPDLAIDAAGYLYVAWVADPGVLMRARSAAADDPLHWAYVEGLAANEPLATPTIAVSGGGDFARVFIACGWYTANYDLYAYEWTLLFMFSSDGGRNITYDYFLPDGYPDYWPDAAMNGSLVHLVNAQADYDSGELDVLVASDQYSGTFLDVASLAGWTPNNCGFPRLACQGDQVFVVYQHDWTDGVSTDGDIIYSYSWDGAQSWFGPVEMIADPYESVGPTVFTRDGLVGCLWLDAPPGGDEFDLAARLGSGGGHSGLFGSVETVSDQPRVEPQFHAEAGVITGGNVHAAWIDRRDYPTQGHNVYTANRPLRPNLAPHQPDGWAAALVAAPRRGGRTDTWLAAGDTTFVSFAFLNDGLADAGASFTVRLDLDGAPQAAWTVGGLPAATWAAVQDHPLVVPAGAHTLAMRLDTGGQVAEDDESDNVLARTFTWIDGDPVARAEPASLVISLDPTAGAAAAAALVQDPPLLVVDGPARLDPRLAAAMDKAAGAALLPVILVPSQRLDAAALGRRLGDVAAPRRRGTVLDAARIQTDRSLQALRPRLDQLAAAGLAGPPRALWLAGAIGLDATPLAVEQLAALPGIAGIWLDDVPSEAFGGPSAAGVPPAAPAAATRAWHLDKVGAPEAWTRGLTGQGVLVGHVDTGVAYDHPDLANHLWDGGTAYPHHGWDAIDEDTDPYDGDTDWYHGTHTAGLIVGDGTAGIATGVAPGARLMVLRGLPGYFDDLVESLQFGLDHGVALFSLSGGWTNASSDLRVANRYNADVLMAAGVPWICAAGNGDNVGGHLAVPADVPSPGDCPDPWYAPHGGGTAVITVGALTVADAWWTGSSTGPVQWDFDNPYSAVDYHDYPWPPGLMKPDLAAPGDGITSTTAGGGYVAYSGTSMATPIVAGAAAVLLEASPGLTPAALAEVLQTTARDVTTAPAAVGRDNLTGAGLVDLPAALDALDRTGPAAVLTLHNDGVLPLAVSAIYDDGIWLQATAPTAEIPPGGSAQVPVTVDPTGLLAGRVYRATMIVVSNDPASPLLIPVTLDYGSGLSGVGDPVPAAGAARLDNYPNPFNPRTVLRFTARGGAPAELTVYDVRGRLVRTLMRGVPAAGPCEVPWDGCDDRGRGVPSGTYFARLKEGDGAPAVRKLMLVR